MSEPTTPWNEKALPSLHNALTWTIAYQYNRMFISAPNLPPMDKDCITMSDEDPEGCFAALTNGKNVHVLCTDGLHRMLSYCRSRFEFVKAAGGVVEAADSSRRLLMKRNGRWDLPKGKVEAGETLRRAAQREVAEETGVNQLEIGRLICKTYHIYNLYGGWHLKQTAWFTMTAPHELPVQPQAEEGIESVVWTDTPSWKQALAQSYATLQPLADMP
ncbi:MAG: NUDIX domain-containing protein [Bacteroidales bacterium]|nr:NUDIX domain-containing protein [Bacteroidales bacterium]